MMDALRLDARRFPQRYRLSDETRKWLAELVEKFRREGHNGALVTRMEVKLLLDEEARHD